MVFRPPLNCKNNVISEPPIKQNNPAMLNPKYLVTAINKNVLLSLLLELLFGESKKSTKLPFAKCVL